MKKIHSLIFNAGQQSNPAFSAIQKLKLFSLLKIKEVLVYAMV